MGSILMLALVAGAVYLDARMLSARCPELYRRHFNFGPGGWLVLTLLFLGIAGVVYYVRRLRYLRMILVLERGGTIEIPDEKESRLLDGDIPRPEQTSDSSAHELPVSPELSGGMTEEKGDVPRPSAELTDAPAETTEALAGDLQSAGSRESTGLKQLGPGDLRDVLHFRTITDATGVLTLYTLAVVYVSFLISVVIIASGRDVGFSLGGVSVLSVIFNIFLVDLIYRRRPKAEPFRNTISARTARFVPLRDLVLPVALGFGLAYVAHQILGDRTGLPVSPIGNMVIESGLAGLIVYGLTAVLFAPVLEEIIYRGFFYRVIARVKGPLVAFLAISGAFLLAHVGQLWGDWLAILVLLPVSIALTGMRWWTGYIIPGIVLHLAYNLSIFLIPILALVGSGPVGDIMQAEQAQTPEEQQAILRQVIQDHPDYIPAYNQLAWSYATEGTNLEEALRLIDIALRNEPDNYAYLDTKAEVLYQMGRYEEAVEIEARLVIKYPDDAFLRSQLLKFESALRKQMQSEGSRE
jgi:membrane protease YdiL (CAAX protease family)